VVAQAQQVRTDWPMARGDAQGSGAVRLPIEAAGTARAWQFQASSHVWGYQPGMAVWSSAALGLAGGRPVLVAGSYDNNIYCLDALSGEKVWRYTTGGGVYSAPVLWSGRPRGGQAARAMVFAGSSDRAVYALDAADGRREWVHSVQAWRPTMGGARIASPAVGRAQGRDAVFIAHWVWDKSMAGHQQAGGVTALDALSGRPLWTTRLGDNQLSSPIFGEQERVFVASENGNLYALDAQSGRVLWTHGERDAIKSSPALYTIEGRPRLVIGSKFGRVRCLDATTGQVLWRFKAGHWVDGSAAVAEVDGRLVVYVGSYDTNLYALEARSGRLLWSHRTAGGIYSSPAVVHEGGQASVLFASWDHHLHCISAVDGAPRWKKFTGRPIWDSVTLGDSVWSSPSVALLDGQAVVFFGAYSGPFYALPLAAAARELPGPASNLGFWVTLPGVMLATTALTLILTWRHRRRRRRPAP